MASGSLLLLLCLIAPLCLLFIDSDLLSIGGARPHLKRKAAMPLRFRHDGVFKILQVADMHYGNGEATRCKDVPSEDSGWCSDLNTTRFLRRMIEAERPDLIAFTGDNIFGSSATDASVSLYKAIAPAMEHGIPWAAVLGNHDQESTMDRMELMFFLSLMDYSVSQVNPSGLGGERIMIDGFGNYNIEVHGAFGSALANTSILNLYFLDSGDHVIINGHRTYGWIKVSQLEWLTNTSRQLLNKFAAPSLAFFHVPIPEVRDLWEKGFIGSFQEAVACSFVNSGVSKVLDTIGDVKAVFMGHDHLNDFCGRINEVMFCYGGGFGYHGYGRAGWFRRARVISVELEKGHRTWLGVDRIRTWKRIDDLELTKIDDQPQSKNGVISFGGLGATIELLGMKLKKLKGFCPLRKSWLGFVIISINQCSQN